MDPACRIGFRLSLEPKFSVVSSNGYLELPGLAFFLRDEALIKVKIEDALTLMLIRLNFIVLNYTVVDFD